MLPFYRLQHPDSILKHALSYDYEIHAFLALNEKLKTSSKAKEGS